MNDPVTRLMAIGSKTIRYTGIKFLSHSEAFAFIISDEARRLEGMTQPGGKGEIGVKLTLSCQIGQTWTRLPHD